MVDRNIVNKLGLSSEKLEEQIKEMFGEQENEQHGQVDEDKTNLPMLHDGIPRMAT